MKGPLWFNLVDYIIKNFAIVLQYHLWRQVLFIFPDTIKDMD